MKQYKEGKIDYTKRGLYRFMLIKRFISIHKRYSIYYDNKNLCYFKIAF